MVEENPEGADFSQYVSSANVKLALTIHCPPCFSPTPLTYPQSKVSFQAITAMLLEPQHLGRTAIKRKAWAGGRFEAQPVTEDGDAPVRVVRGGRGLKRVWANN